MDEGRSPGRPRSDARPDTRARRSYAVCRQNPRKLGQTPPVNFVVPCAVALRLGTSWNGPLDALGIRVESTVRNNETTWAAVSAPAAENPLQVRSFSLARPRGVFLAAQLALFSASALGALWKNAAFGATALIGCCAIAFYLKALDRSIV